MNLNEKVAIVTGAATGVGRATALRLAAGGCRVVINYRKSQEEANGVREAIEKHGGTAIVRQGDVAQDDDVCRLIDHTIDALGRLDIVVNNAGTTEFIPFDNLDAVTNDVWQQLLSVNLIGPFQVIRAAAEHMQSTCGPDGGEIVNVSSVAGLVASGSSIPYCASKAALNNLTVALARTLAPHIRVNAIAPGFITGRWLQDGLGDRYESTKQAFEQAVPLRRVCTPDDVAAAIVSVISGSDLITGQIITCDGGMTIANPVQV